MDNNVLNYEKLNEKLYIYNHSSGLRVYVMPKKGFTKKYAAFGTFYGSVDNNFIIPGESTPTRVPDGIAHFLEHKLFEQKDGSVMDKFSKLGSSPNAYTSFSQTVYLFSCTDKFDENFRLLLDFVQHPYITEESVEKEKGIIGQEIRMYQDDASWRVFFNLLDAFYVDHPVKIDIAGTIESISKINRDFLYKCYNTFYHPSNMAIVVAGDVEPNAIFTMVDSALGDIASKPEIKRLYPEEKPEINMPYREQKLAVSTPLFQMGYKDINKQRFGYESMQREIAIKLLLEIIFGKSSAFYEKLYNMGLVNNTFEFDYMCEPGFSCSIFGGESTDPEKVRNLVVQEIERVYKDGLDQKAFERILKASKGRFMKRFNSVENIAHSFMSRIFRDVNMFDYYKVYDTITIEYINGVFKEHFDNSRLALSVVKPI